MSESKQRGPQWSNSYESQLSDGELQWLHSALLARSPSDKQIRDKMPPWRDGPRKGQPISLATLSNIRDRLEMEETFRADEATTESVLEELKRELPTLSDQQIDEIGHRTFSLLTLRNRDLKGFVRLRSARTKAELEKAKLALQEKAEERQREQLHLDQKRFQRETCELFLKWAEDIRAQEIARSPATNSQKIDELGQLMFGDDWKPAGAAA